MMLPAPEFFLGLSLGLVLGFTAERFLHFLRGRRRRCPMNVKPLPNWYLRFAPTLMIFLIGMVTVALVVAIVGIRGDAKRNEEVLACVDKWASAVSGSLPPVREASILKDEAEERSRRAWVRWLKSKRDVDALFVRALAGEDVREEAGPVFAKVVKAADGVLAHEVKVKAAADELNQAREDNPYPETPSIYCTQDADAD